MCCDDVAASVSGDAAMYARALVQFASYHQAHFDVAVAATGGPLSDRIVRLLGQSRPNVRSSLGPGVLAVALFWAPPHTDYPDSPTRNQLSRRRQSSGAFLPRAIPLTSPCGFDGNPAGG